MRTTLLVLGGLLAAAFAATFGATFFARDRVTKLAEDYVIDQTQRHVEPLIQIAEDALRVPGLKFVAKDAEAIATGRAELAEYRRDPRGYIAKLVAADPGAPVANPGRGAPLKDQVLFWKAEIREHFERTLDHLLFDLRIFFGTNCAVALLTAACAYWSRGRMVVWLVPVAILLLLSLGFSIYMYVDNLTFFRILTDTYVGWGYPKLLGVVFLVLLVRLGRLVFGLTALTQKGRAEPAR